MNLYEAIDGQGPDVVFLHGWGLHGGVFNRVATSLNSQFTTHCVDLPGHGASPAREPMNINEAVQAIDNMYPFPVHLVGWSLGGLLAQYWAAHQSDKIRSLTLINTSPHFIIDVDWPHGIGRDRLAAIAYRLDVDFEQTLQQFLALQTLGAPNAQATLHALSDILFAHGSPKGLHTALHWLLDGDARPFVANITCPVALCYGVRDRITPPGAQHWLDRHLPNVCSYPFEQASHTPFLSHEADFCRILQQHLQENT